MRQKATLACSAWALFCDIAADAPHAAYIDTDEFSIVSASPELFFTLQGEALTCRPMKGTAHRGMTAADDRRVRDALRDSEKDRAENVMVTDMVRNDMGRIARAGSVTTQALFALEKYATVWQMTSTVRAHTDASISSIFKGLFPPASITGTPKAASMALIAELEDSPREIYTGAIGVIAPGRRANFNVAIRTAWLDKHDGIATYGVGGGIVWDSDPEAEYEECRVKSRVLSSSATARGFSLLETLRWVPGDGYFLLNEHLERLRQSATYFDFACDLERVQQSLAAAAAEFGDTARRVRLEVDRDGRCRVRSEALPSGRHDGPQRIVLAAEPVAQDDPFLYHKTTHRDVYDRARRRAGANDDVLLWNGDGLVTETTIANVLIELDGEIFTPPVSAGLLGGTLRRRLLESGEIAERDVHVDELRHGMRLTLINSVRGRYDGTLWLREQDQAAGERAHD